MVRRAVDVHGLRRRRRRRAREKNDGRRGDSRQRGDVEEELVGRRAGLDEEHGRLAVAWAGQERFNVAST